MFYFWLGRLKVSRWLFFQKPFFFFFFTVCSRLICGCNRFCESTNSTLDISPLLKTTERKKKINRSHCQFCDVLNNYSNTSFQELFHVDHTLIVFLSITKQILCKYIQRAKELMLSFGSHEGTWLFYNLCMKPLNTDPSSSNVNPIGSLMKEKGQFRWK